MRLEICRMQLEKHRCTRCDLSYMTNHSVYTGLYKNPKNVVVGNERSNDTGTSNSHGTNNVYMVDNMPSFNPYQSLF